MTDPQAPEPTEPEPAQPDPAVEAPFEELLADCLEAFDRGGDSALAEVLDRHLPERDRLLAAVNRVRDSGLVGPRSSVVGSHPEELGGYRIQRRLGGGGMGVVYLAHDAEDHPVALKLLRPEQLFMDKARARFRREVEAVSMLDHPGIVPIERVGEDDGVPFFAMEYVHGCSLAEVLEEIHRAPQARLRGRTLREALARQMGQPKPSSSPGTTDPDGIFAGTWENACLKIIQRVAEAMQHAHERQIVHRDLKPSNVMLTPAGDVRLVDFGLAYLQSSEKLTRSGSVLGSLVYMPPEQVRGKGVDERSDIYSLGATMFELLALSPPFLDSDPVQLPAEILHGQVRPLRRLAPTVTRSVENVCMKAMAREPGQRYQSMAELARDLRNLLEERPVTARPPGAVLRMRRFWARHAVLSLAMTLVFVVVVAGPLALWLLQLKATRDLEEANTKLAVANTELGEQRAHAEANFDRALAAVDQLLTRVGDRSLRHVPFMLQVRQGLLQDALRLYRELRQEDPNNQDVTRKVGIALVRVGFMHREIGDMKTARMRIEEGLAALESLAQTHPEPHKVTADVGEARMQHGGVLQLMSELDAAERTFQRGIDMLEVLHKQRPEYARAAQVLASLYSSMGGLLLMREDPDGANVLLERSLALREALVKRYPDSFLFKDTLARQLRRLSPSLRARGQFKEALVKLERALEIYDDLQARHRPDPKLLSGRALCYEEMGTIYMRFRRFEDAIDVHDKSARLRQRLMRENPQKPAYRGQLAASMSNAAGARLSLGRRREAAAMLRQAVGYQKRTLRMLPRHPNFRRFLRIHYRLLCRALRELGRVEELRKVCKDMADHDWVPGRGAYDAAAQLLSIPDPQDRELVRGDVLVLLRQSVEQGYGTPERLAVPWLQHLRGEARYQAALELAKAKAKTKAKTTGSRKAKETGSRKERKKP